MTESEIIDRIAQAICKAEGYAYYPDDNPPDGHYHTLARAAFAAIPAPDANERTDEWQRLQAAYDRVKAFPEFTPAERAHWLELRQAVEKVLEGRGP